MNPNRDDIEAELLAYVEGQLAPADAARVEVFLDNTDPKLAALVRGMMDDRQALRAAPRLKAPADLAERIMERVERTSLLGTSVDQQLVTEHRQWWHSRMAIAAGLLLIFGVFGYFVADSVWPRSQKKWERVAEGPEPMAASDQPAKEAAKPAAVSATPLADGTAKEEERVAPDHTSETLLAAQLDRDRAVAERAIDAGRFGFVSLPSAQAALENLWSVPRNADEEAPMVVTLKARDATDVERLHRLLAAYAAEASGGSAEDKMETADAVVAGGSRAKNAEASPRRGGGGRAGSGSGGLKTPSQGQSLSQAPLARGTAGRDANSKSAAAPQASVLFAGEPAAPYRVRLRPSQIEALGNEFAVAAITQGPRAYLIEENAKDAPLMMQRTTRLANEAMQATQHRELLEPNRLAAGDNNIANRRMAANTYDNNGILTQSQQAKADHELSQGISPGAEARAAAQTRAEAASHIGGFTAAGKTVEHGETVAESVQPQTLPAAVAQSTPTAPENREAADAPIAKAARNTPVAPSKSLGAATPPMHQAPTRQAESRAFVAESPLRDDVPIDVVISILPPPPTNGNALPAQQSR